MGLSTQKYTMNMGPQHPSTHGVLRLELELDGERCTKCETKIGYLHRGIEKLAESRKYPQVLPYTDRLDYLSGLSNNFVYAATVEKMMDTEISERTQVIRVMLLELMRLASHLLGIGIYIMDLGAVTAVFYPYIEREKIIDLLSMLSGSRLTFSFMRIGGLSADLPEGFLDETEKFLDSFAPAVEKYHEFLDDNEILRRRTEGVGVVSAETAKSYGLTGPNLRASGVDYDLRKVSPYSSYEKFDFEIPLGTNGDCFDRYIVRVRELEESAKIVRQAVEMLRRMPSEGIEKIPKVVKPAAGSCYCHFENPKGILGCYVESGGGLQPERVHFRRPSFCNISVFDEIVPGHLMGDVVAIVASFDMVLGEVDG